LSELIQIADTFRDAPMVWVSTGPMVVGLVQKYGPVYIVGECNRQHPIRSFVVALRCLRVVFRERPSVVISAGAAPGFLVCFWAKLFGAKIVWVDSIANIVDLSMSGRMVRRLADLILSQWPEVAARYPNVEYAGELI